MKNNITLLWMFIFCNVLLSQNCNFELSGKIEDFHENLVLENAVVHIKNLNRFVTTDKQGFFKFTKLCKGNLTIEISHISCELKTITVSLTKNTHKIISLEHHIEDLDEVKVSHLNTHTATKQTSNITNNLLENYSSASLGDALKEVSGISSINTGQAIVKPIINGLHSSRISIMTNGVRLQDHDWGVEHAPSIDLNSVGNITVYKGANALEYSGDAIGGVVVIKPKNIILKDTLFGKTIISGQTNSSALTGTTSLNKYTKKGWYIGGNASFKKFGDAETADYNLSNTGVQSTAFSINTGFKNFEHGFDFFYSYLDNEIGILAASHLGNQTDLLSAINAHQPLIINDFSYTIDNPKQEVKHHLAKALGYKRFKGLGKLQLQYHYQNNKRLEFDRRRGDRDAIPASDLTLQTHTFQTDFKFDAKKERVYKIGIMAQYQNNFANPDTGVRRFIPDYDKYDIGAFAIATYQFENFIIDAGIRYDFNKYNAKKFYQKNDWEAANYNTNFNHFIIGEEGFQWLTNPKLRYNNISFSAGINYSLNENSKLIFNYGLANRAPNPAELFSDGLHHSASRIEVGNLNLNQETSNRLGATYKYANNKWNLGFEGYVNFINNFIFIAPTDIKTTIRGAFFEYNYLKTNAALYGLDAVIDYTFSDNFSFRNKSSYIIGNDTKNNTALIDMPPLQVSNKFTYTNKEFHNFYSEIESVFVGKQTRLPKYTFIDSNEFINSIIESPDAYHLLNFDAGAKFLLNKTELDIRFSLDNILNTNYRDYLNRMRFFADELGRNFKLTLIIKY